MPKEMMRHYTSLESIKIFHAGNHFMSFPLGIFPNLCSIWFVMGKGLEKVYIPEGIDDNRLVSPSELRAGACPRLEIIGKEAGEGGATVLPAPNLTFFDTNSCEKLKPALIEMKGEVLLPKIKQLTIEKPLRSIWRSLFRFSCLTAFLVSDMEMECFPNPDGGWSSLPTSLRYLEIMECPKLRRVDGKALQILSSLQELHILSCIQLESLLEEGLPLSLGHLVISKCP
uniref:Adenylate cyclase n=1 Tax=Opuntia streptacantha TaxID=393608 RepID=A0A7C9D380_OPUST